MKVYMEQEILQENAAQAAENRKAFGQTLVINIIGSPGCGKTTILEKTLPVLAREMRVAVIEGDVYTAKDAARVEAAGVPVVQVNTAGGCHISAEITAKAAAGLLGDVASATGAASANGTASADKATRTGETASSGSAASADTAPPDLLIIENVGNLVCPAEFDLGEDHKIAVLSTTEGDDKPAKYPLLFREASLVLINKMDLMPYINFDVEAAERDIRSLNPGAEILRMDAAHGEGLAPWLDWLRREVSSKKNQPF